MRNDERRFVLKDKDILVPMEASFAREADFQFLLAKFPELLSGDQIDPSSPRKWILVRREMAVPSEENGSSRWSLDHLFLDQDGVPTLIEVKRQSDTRIRREVVGQMLDYAANSVVYWPVEGLQADLEVTSAAQGKLSADALTELLGPEASETEFAEFWLKVKTNLAAGRIRLLFVADAIPSELRRIIEFLNRQMDPAEVLGVELRQFEGQGLQALVPLVVGHLKTPPVRPDNRQWDKASILAEIQSRFSEAELEVARGVAEWMEGSGGSLSFGSGQKGSTSVGFTNNDGVRLDPIRLWTDGGIAIPPVKQWKRKPFFDEMENRRELIRRLKEIDGVNIANDDRTRPLVRLSDLSSSPSKTQKFVSILNWIVDGYRSS
jgi:hypothetical protein